MIKKKMYKSNNNNIDNMIDDYLVLTFKYIIFISVKCK